MPHFFKKCIYWLSVVVYIFTIVLLMMYFTKYYYHRCILMTEVHPIKVLPYRCRWFRKLRRFIWFFIIVPFVLKRAVRTIKFYTEFSDLRRLDKYAYLTYFIYIVSFLLWSIDIEFDMYWDLEWEEVRFYYYLPEMDVYYTGLDTPAMEYFDLN